MSIAGKNYYQVGQARKFAAFMPFADDCSFDELHYDAAATDFAVFASHGKFTLSSVRSIVETSVSANAEGLFEILHTPKGASPAGGRQGFKVTLR